MKLSVIIVNWNTTDLCVELLSSIEKFAPKCEYEVILVDNASRDFENYDFSKYDFLKIIRNKKNLKYAKGNNIGIRESCGEYVMLFNPDIKVTENSMDMLINFLDAQSDYMGACPKLVLLNGEIDRSIRGFPYFLPLISDFTGITRFFPKSKVLNYYKQNFFNYKKEGDALQPMTSAMLIRRKHLEEIGTFDEDFPIFFNDVDLLYRAFLKGLKIRYLPNSLMFHIHGASTAKAGKAKMKAESLNSLMKFYKKHFEIKYSKLGVYLICKLILQKIPKEMENETSNQYSNMEQRKRN